MSVWSCVCRGQRPLSSEHGACKTVRARFSPWRSGKIPENLFRCSLFAKGFNRKAKARLLSYMCHIRSTKKRTLLRWRTLPPMAQRIKSSQLRCRENMAYLRQPRPNSGLGFWAEALKSCSLFAQKRLNAVSGLQVSKLPVSRLKVFGLDICGSPQGCRCT